jgi:hypothetical protein
MRFFIRGTFVARVFSGAHEAVTGALVGGGLVFLVKFFHQLSGIFDGGGDAVVIAAVEAKNGAVDALHLVFAGRLAVENKSGLQIFIVRSVTEGLAAAPAEAGNCDFAVAGRKLGDVRGSRIEVASDLIRRQGPDRLANGIAPAKLFRAAALGPQARKEIRGDGNVAGFREFVSNAAGPVGKAKDLVDDEDGAGLALDLRISDVAIDLARAVFNFHPLEVPRGFFKSSFGPILSVRGSGGGERECGDEEPAFHVLFLVFSVQDSVSVARQLAGEYCIAVSSPSSGRSQAHNDIEFCLKFAGGGAFEGSKVNDDGVPCVLIFDLAEDAVTLVFRFTFDVALRRPFFLGFEFDGEMDVPGPAGIKDGLDAAEIVLAGRAGEEAAEALEIWIGLCVFVGGMMINPVIVGLPDFDQRVAKGISAAVENASGEVRDLARGRRKRVVYDDKVVVSIEREVIGVKWAFGLARGADEFFGKGAGNGIEGRQKSGAFKERASIGSGRIHEGEYRSKLAGGEKFRQELHIDNSGEVLDRKLDEILLSPEGRVP